VIARVALVALVASCGRPPTAAAQPARAAAGPAGGVQRVCGSPGEAALRARLPGLVACGRRLVVVAHAAVRGRALDVVGYDGDPCCVDTGPPEMMEGSTVYLDGARYEPAAHGGRPVTAALGPLTGLPDDAARALLQAVLVMRGVRAQVLSDDDQRALFARWPAARAAVESAPPGLRPAAGGRALTVWNERALAERGVSCRLLERHTAALSADGALTFSEPAVFGEGERMGRPCAAPLPARPRP
jgi:hypothetical protein